MDIDDDGDEQQQQQHQLLLQLQSRLAELRKRASAEYAAMIDAVREVDPSRVEDAIAAAGSLLPSHCADALREWGQKRCAEAYLHAAQSIKKAHATKHPPSIAAAKRAVLDCNRPSLSAVCAEVVDPLARSLAMQHHTKIRAICAESGWPPPLLNPNGGEQDDNADQLATFPDSKLFQLGTKVRDSIKALEALEDSGGLGAANALVLEPLRSRILEVFSTPASLAYNTDAFALLLVDFAQTYIGRLSTVVPLSVAHLLGSLSTLAGRLIADLCVPVAYQLRGDSSQSGDDGSSSGGGGGAAQQGSGGANRVVLSAVDNCLVVSRALDKILEEYHGEDGGGEADQADVSFLRPMLYSSLDLFASDHAARQLWIDAEEAEVIEQVHFVMEPSTKARPKSRPRSRPRSRPTPTTSCTDGFWSRDSLPSSVDAIGQVIIGLARRFEGLPQGQIAATARGVVQRCSLQCVRAICKQAERRIDECVADGFASENRVREAALTCSVLAALIDYLTDDLSLDPVIAQLDSVQSRLLEPKVKHNDNDDDDDGDGGDGGNDGEDEEELLDPSLRVLSECLEACLSRIQTSFIKIYKSACSSHHIMTISSSWRAATADNVVEGCAQLESLFETVSEAVGRQGRVTREIASRCGSSICHSALSTASGWVDMDTAMAMAKSVSWLQALKANLAPLLERYADGNTSSHHHPSSKSKSIIAIIDTQIERWAESLEGL